MLELRVQANLSASTAVLTGLQILQIEIMQQSVIDQDIEEQGALRGKPEEALSLVLRLPWRRIGPISPNIQAQIQYFCQSGMLPCRVATNPKEFYGKAGEESMITKTPKTIKKAPSTRS